MNNLRLEVWKSNENQEEIHYFVGNVYLLGYNPALVPMGEVQKILLDLGYELPSNGT